METRSIDEIKTDIFEISDQITRLQATLDALKSEFVEAVQETCKEVGNGISEALVRTLGHEPRTKLPAILDALRDTSESNPMKISDLKATIGGKVQLTRYREKHRVLDYDKTHVWLTGDGQRQAG